MRVPPAGVVSTGNMCLAAWRPRQMLEVLLLAMLQFSGQQPSCPWIQAQLVVDLVDFPVIPSFGELVLKSKTRITAADSLANRCDLPMTQMFGLCRLAAKTMWVVSCPSSRARFSKLRLPFHDQRRKHKHGTCRMQNAVAGASVRHHSLIRRHHGTFRNLRAVMQQPTMPSLSLRSKTCSLQLHMHG